jgi:hypothetical protein
MKYLVWDIKAKRFSQNSHFCLAPNGNLYRAGRNVTDLKIICFGSGVQDDNGNEIFAGHIIEIGKDSPQYFEVVEFKNGIFQTKEECKSLDNVMSEDFGSGCVIVGHILTHDFTPNGVVPK